MQPEIFHIAPVAQKTSWLGLGFSAFGIIMVALVAGAMLFAWKSVQGAKHAEFHVDGGGLRIKSFPFSRFVPFAVMDLANAEIVDIRQQPELRPRRRTAGTALGALKAGWFRLQNRAKALLFLTNQDAVAVIPTTKGYTLLLSPAEPERFLAQLRRAAAG